MPVNSCNPIGCDCSTYIVPNQTFKCIVAYTLHFTFYTLHFTLYTLPTCSLQWSTCSLQWTAVWCISMNRSATVTSSRHLAMSGYLHCNEQVADCNVQVAPCNQQLSDCNEQLAPCNELVAWLHWASGRLQWAVSTNATSIWHIVMDRPCIATRWFPIAMSSGVVHFHEQVG